ncbi:MAG: histone [Promethearchaeota archaeon]
MSPKKKPSTHSIGRSFAKQIIKEAGGSRIAKEAASELQEELYAIGKELAINAVEITHQKKRKTVSAKDIQEAVQRVPDIWEREEIEIGSKDKPISLKHDGEDKPLFHHIWFINSNSGNCLLSRSYSGLKFPDTIFSGLLTGIADLMREVTGRNLRHLILGDLRVHMGYVSPVLVVIICDPQEAGLVRQVAQKLGHQFLDLYADELDKQLQDLELFEEFEHKLEETIRDAGMELPTTVAVEEVGDTTLTRESIEESVTGAALREELLSASELLKGFPLFDQKEPIKTEGGQWDRLSEIVQRTREQVSEQLKKIDKLFEEASENI